MEETFIHLHRNKLNRKRNILILLVPTIFFLLILFFLFSIENNNIDVAKAPSDAKSVILGESDNALDTNNHEQLK